MSSKYEAYVNTKFNDILITECFKKIFAEKNKQRLKYAFKYDCLLCNSKNNICRCDSVILGNLKNCGCVNKSIKGNKNSKWKGYEEISGSWFYNVKNRAKITKRKIDFKLEDIWHLYINQNKKCKLSGVDIFFNLPNNTVKGYTRFTASLDRIDSSKDYTVDNIQLVHNDINLIKQSYSNEKIINWSYLINNKTIIPNSAIILKRTKAWNGYGNVEAKCLTAPKRNNQWTINIDLKYLWELFLEQNCQCAISGEILNFSYKKRHKTASLDRIDSSKGYIKDNVQWVHNEINLMKQDYNQDVFLDWMNKIYLHNFGEKHENSDAG